MEILRIKRQWTFCSQLVREHGIRIGLCLKDTAVTSFSSLATTHSMIESCYLRVRALSTHQPIRARNACYDLCRSRIMTMILWLPHHSSSRPKKNLQTHLKRHNLIKLPKQSKKISRRSSWMSQSSRSSTEPTTKSTLNNMWRVPCPDLKWLPVKLKRLSWQ